MKFWETVRLSQIKEVWANWLGWYWFVTEYHEGNLAFGLMRKDHLEWGFINLAWLQTLESNKQAWRIAKENWGHCPDVVKPAQRRPKRNWSAYSGAAGTVAHDGTNGRRWRCNDG